MKKDGDSAYRPKINAAIFARGGSKGVPRKNIRPLAGISPLARAVRIAQQVKLIDKVFVSTDDPEIAEAARQAGAQVPFMRPAELSHDTASEWLAWQHLIRTLEEQGEKFDYMVSLPATSPLREAQDVEKALQLMLEEEPDIVLAVTESERNPYFNMVTLDDARNARIAIKAPGEILRRQDAPRMYDITTVVYVARTGFVLASNGLFEGRVKATLVPRDRALDIDTEYDFRIAELLLSEASRRG